MDDQNKLEHVVLEGARTQIMSEREFRERIVIKLLEALGWSGQDDIQFEYNINVGTSTIRADYLVGSSNKRLILEVKSPRVPITANDGNSKQTISYLKLIDEALYAILYNGKKMIIFQKGSDTPVYIWDPAKDFSIFRSLRKENFPFLLDVLTGKASPDETITTTSVKLGEKNSLDNSNFSEDMSNGKTYWTNLRIIGYFTIVSLIFLFVFIALGAPNNRIGLNVVYFFTFLFLWSTIAFSIELVRVRHRKLVNIHKN